MIDVCLILEGTYPYVAGGVSTWVNQLITSMKDIRFGIVYIAPHSDPTKQFKYQVPNHVIYLKEVYLHDYDINAKKNRRPRDKDFELIRQFIDELIRKDLHNFQDFISLFQGPKSCMNIQTLFSAKKIWDILTNYYERFAEQTSFLDYFWSWRGIHLPLLQILQTEVPSAKIYHSISTGYAGLLGAIAKQTQNGVYLLTEHGIYTHERLLEISQANWIYEQQKRSLRADPQLSFFKQWWVNMFRMMSQITYYYCDEIYTLYEGNKIREILDGAEPRKIKIIPNGINLKTFGVISRQKKEKPQIGLIGRVVTIKDIKTFIQAAKLCSYKIPEAQFYVVGPTDEESDYFEECKMLVETLGLQEHFKFTGNVDVKEYYKFLDIVVLTSISEAQPYVILEANISGIPVVSTDVGACREMLDGSTDDDRNLGPSGIITEVANPAQTAQAIIKLIQEKDFYETCSQAGKTRVKMYYNQEDLLSKYLNIYERHL